MSDADEGLDRPVTALDALPAGASMLARAAATALRRPKGEPRLEPAGVRVRAVAADAEGLAAYRRVCGLRRETTLPLTYPHVMVEALQLWLMSRPGFPLPMLGLVHLANRFEQDEAIPVEARLDFTVWLGNAERTARGFEFEVVTEAAAPDGHRLWRGVSTYLYRIATPGPHAHGEHPALPTLDRYEPIEVPAATGRRYAAVSGDYNPIHLSLLSARLFGFKRAIAHGMWSAARCLGALQEAHGVAASRLQVRFRQPLLLPANAQLRSREDGDGVEFLLVGKHDRLYLEGRLG
ncbi:MAG TPA: MaoC/PaaZ C-terminal domain-containing protein [Nevskiaceae bacterium]|nr:MaoC/PaaZ C-terminal domain-containing protein [Nevskiaceae bacterium]